MTSPCCQEHIEVQTDPKNHEYIIVSGARRKVRRPVCVAHAASLCLHEELLQHVLPDCQQGFALPDSSPYPCMQAAGTH